jgi:hypothetical protein
MTIVGHGREQREAHRVAIDAERVHPFEPLGQLVVAERVVEDRP